MAHPTCEDAIKGSNMAQSKVGLVKHYVSDPESKCDCKRLMSNCSIAVTGFCIFMTVVAMAMNMYFMQQLNYLQIEQQRLSAKCAQRDNIALENSLQHSSGEPDSSGEEIVLESKNTVIQMTKSNDIKQIIREILEETQSDLNLQYDDSSSAKEEGTEKTQSRDVLVKPQTNLNLDQIYWRSKRSADGERQRNRHNHGEGGGRGSSASAKTLNKMKKDIRSTTKKFKGLDKKVKKLQEDVGGLKKDVVELKTPSAKSAKGPQIPSIHMYANLDLKDTTDLANDENKSIVVSRNGTIIGAQYYQGFVPAGKDKIYAFWEANRDYDTDIFLHTNSYVEIRKSGVYLIYAQVHYHETSPTLGFKVLVNGAAYTQCYTGVDYTAPGTVGPKWSRSSVKGCFTARVLHLGRGDRIQLADNYDFMKVFTNFTNATSWGLIQLQNLETGILAT